MKTSLWQMLVVLVFISISVMTAQNGETITRKQIPSGVIKAVHLRFPADSIISQQTTTINQKKYFSLETAGEKHKSKLLVTPDGKIFEIREPLLFIKLPDRAQTMLNNEHSRIKLIQLETVTQDSVITYDLVCTEGGNISEYIFDAKGNTLNSSQHPADNGEDRGR